MSRTRKALTHINKSMRVLEIGPGYAPLAPKSLGWNVTTVDHATQEALRNKYKPHGVAVDQIESVDFVWTGGPVHAVIPETMHGTFDACVASHVLEHLPDPISFLQSVSRLLKADGIVSLVLPDKRFCFDFFRPITMSSAWLEAFERKAIRHSQRTAFEQAAYAITNHGRGAWGRHRRLAPTLIQPLDSAWQSFEQSRTQVDYQDFHAWCFTPASFDLILIELSALGLVDYRAVETFPTLGCEFFISLRKGSRPTDDLDKRRLALLYRISVETAEQAALLANPGAAACLLATFRLILDRSTDGLFWRRRLAKLMRPVLRRFTEPAE